MGENSLRALNLPDIIYLILRSLASPGDVARCARLNPTWSIIACAILWQGSYVGDAWKTPWLCELDKILKEDPERLKYYLSLVRHLHLTFFYVNKNSLYHNDPDRDGNFLPDTEADGGRLDFECLKDVTLWQACAPVSITVSSSLYFQSSELIGHRSTRQIEPTLYRLLIDGGLLSPAIRILDLDETLLSGKASAAIKIKCPNLQWLRSTLGPIADENKDCLRRLLAISLPLELGNRGVILSRCLNVQHLEARDLYSHLSNLSFPNCFQNLKSLVLWDRKMTLEMSDPTLRKLLAHTPNLEILHVEGFSGMFEGDQRVHCPKLKRVSLACWPWSVPRPTPRVESIILDFLFELPNLQSLRLVTDDPYSSHPTFQGAGLQADSEKNFATILPRSCPMLEELEWSCFPHRLSAEDFSCLAKLPNLRAMSLGKVDLSFEVLEKTPATVVFSALEFLEWHRRIPLPSYELRDCSDHDFDTDFGSSPEREQGGRAREFRKTLRTHMPRLRRYKAWDVQMTEDAPSVWGRSSQQYRYWHERYRTNGDAGLRIANLSKASILSEDS